MNFVIKTEWWTTFHGFKTPEEHIKNIWYTKPGDKWTQNDDYGDDDCDCRPAKNKKKTCTLYHTEILNKYDWTVHIKIR